MKYVKKATFAAVLFLLALGLTTYSATAQAAKKTPKKVRYTLKKGTLTISGKGAMPSDMVFKGNNKIKKIVIKKGVTSIPDDAFMNCRKLKRVSIPSSVKKIGSYSFCNTKIKNLVIPAKVKSIGQNAFMNCSKLKKLTVPGNFDYKVDKRDEAFYNLTAYTELDTVTFNTNLELKNVPYFNTNNLVVKSGDPLYKSIDGVIYSKDGKCIVRVPYLRRELVIDKGCTEFCLQSVLYSERDYDSNYCKELVKITIPASVKEVNYEKYFANYQFGDSLAKVNLVIQSKQMDGISLALIMQWFDLQAKELQQKLPGQIAYKNHMYITKDNLLLAYDGSEADVKVPAGIKIIGPRVFCYNETIRTVELPESLEAIESDAFAGTEIRNINLPQNLKYIGAGAFYDSLLSSVKLPAGLQEIGEEAFAECRLSEINWPEGVTTIPFYVLAYTNLKKIDIPDTVTKIDYAAFLGCEELREIKIGKGVKEIDAYAFAYAIATEIKIPANVKIIGEEAFSTSVWDKGYQREIKIFGSSKQIAPTAFDSDVPGDTVLIYKKGPKEFKTGIQDCRNKKINEGERKVTCQWHKVSGATGYQLCYYSDKIFKNKIKTVTLKKNQISYKINLKTKSKKIYVKIRPYKKVKGKKVYGRWTDTWD